jgi:hypothetical protein
MDLSFLKWLYIFFLSLGSGVFGSWLARLSTRYFESMFKTVQELLRTLIQSFIYSVLVLIGVVANLFTSYGIPMYSWEIFAYMITAPFWEMFAWFLALKLFVFLLSDFIADKFAFGG